jgi:NRPS condensation-like uncharacterized protein
MTCNRELGMLETYVKFFYEEANGTTGVTAVIQLAGPLTADLIKRGLLLLQKRHPLLRATLSQSKSGRDCFEIDKEPLEMPLNIQNRVGSEQWIQIYERQLNETFISRQRYLWHLTALLDDSKEGNHELIASFHHTIIDGQSLGNFFCDLLSYLQALSNGETTEIESLPMMPNFEQLQDKMVGWNKYLQKSEAGFKQLLDIKDDLYPYENNPPLFERQTKVICDESGKSQLERMVSRSRENNTTLTSLLYAALLLALYQVKGEEDGHSGRHQITVTPVDMRSRCSPVIASDVIGSYVSVVTTVHHVETNTPLWDLARSCGEQIKKGVGEQAYYPKAFDRETFLEILRGMGKGPLEGKFFLGIGITNYGLLDLPLEFGPFHVNKFHSGATRHAGDWLMLLHTASVGGKLCYDFCYEVPLLSEKTAGKIVETFFSILQSACH